MTQMGTLTKGRILYLTGQLNYEEISKTVNRNARTIEKFIKKYEEDENILVTNNHKG